MSVGIGAIGIADAAVAVTPQNAAVAKIIFILLIYSSLAAPLTRDNAGGFRPESVGSLNLHSDKIKKTCASFIVHALMKLNLMEPNNLFERATSVARKSFKSEEAMQADRNRLTDVAYEPRLIRLFQIVARPSVARLGTSFSFPNEHLFSLLVMSLWERALYRRSNAFAGQAPGHTSDAARWRHGVES